MMMSGLGPELRDLGSTVEEPCQTLDVAEKWVYSCRVNESTDLLNMAFICDRDGWHTASFVILYLLVSVTAMASNASVVLASIVERWKEIDQFTFVFAVSLSFNHFLVAFLVYPLGAYTMLRTDGWGLGNYWCTFTAYCTSYFEVLYMMHIQMILFDMLLYRFTKLKEVVKVFLVKKVAMSLWVTALLPHMVLMWDQSWFLTDGGTLGIKQKYVKCNEGNTVKDTYTTSGGEPEPVINCFTAYTFTTYTELNIYLLCFFILPVTYAAVSYTLLLYLRKRSMLKGNRKEEVSEEDALENSRTFIQRYKASLCMVLVFSVTQLPKWITSIYLLYLDTSQKNAAQAEGSVGTGTMYETDMVIRMDFLSFWTCLGSILIPFCYMMTCPTYFHAVTATRPLLWLRKHGEVIHGRTYSRRLRLPEKDTDKGESEKPVSSTPNTLDIPTINRARTDTDSKIIMNSIAEEGGTEQKANYAELSYNSLGRNSVISNHVASDGDNIRRVMSPGDVSLLVMLGSQDNISEDEEVNQLTVSHKDNGDGPDIEPCGIPVPDSGIRPASLPPYHATPITPGPQDDRRLSEAFPSQQLRYRELMDMSTEDKHQVKRKLPVPKSSRATTPDTPSQISTSPTPRL